MADPKNVALQDISEDLGELPGCRMGWVGRMRSFLWYLGFLIDILNYKTIYTMRKKICSGKKNILIKYKTEGTSKIL
ncbi:hypothetical protein X798_07954 [Onchocerca flexuosa]|uniref:Uncharacterized protein n=1 Tax=Onchocerca flexuosa TaxID=387005 RepID=A0A238BHX9_9BILA|nr:hypothetical protein X798_07954 [Onchocerca flexuosa]